MKHINYAVIPALLLLAGAAHASSKQLPGDLQYNGKPLDALCFFDMENKTGAIDLTNCGAQKNNVKIKGQNSVLKKKGYTGFNYEDNYNMNGYSYYKAFAAGNQQYWIHSVNNGGGTGEFTAISLVKRVNDTSLSEKNIVGGDRCNNGVDDVKVRNSRLTYSVNLTPFAFLPLANDNPNNIKGIDDLADCASCCAAKAYFEASSTTQPILRYVALQNIKDTSQMTQQGTKQACFNTLYAAYVKKGKINLNENELKQFVKSFNDTCLK